MKKLGFILLLIISCCVTSCNLYKNKIIGKWELLTISDENMSFRQIKSMKVNQPTIESFSKSGEYISDHGCYTDKDRYIISSDTLIYESSTAKFKILKLKRHIMVLENINSPSFIYFRRSK